MTKPKTLREWMSDQQAPPEIQEKMQQLFRLPEHWLLISRGLSIEPFAKIHAQDLESILGAKKHLTPVPE